MSAIGFIGIGNMGLPMSANLVKAGYTVRAYDIIPKHMVEAEEVGCVAVGSIAEACEGAEAIITIVPEGEHVRDVYMGDDGVLTSADTAAWSLSASPHERPPSHRPPSPPPGHT
mgnify:CR=1 FL=1